MKDKSQITIIVVMAFIWSIIVNYCLNTLGHDYSFFGWQKWVLIFIPIFLVGGIDIFEKTMLTKKLKKVLDKKLENITPATNIIQTLSKLSQEGNKKFSKKDIEKIVSKFKK